MHKIRAEITKGEEIRYISHLDYASVLERAIRRTQLPVAYSEGFNPHMKISFASALAVGVTSAAEYMDIEFKSAVSADVFVEKLRANLPEGVKLLAAKMIVDKQPALMAMVDLAEYTVDVLFAGDWDLLVQATEAFNASAEVFYLRKTPKSKKEIEVKQYMHTPVVVQKIDDMIRFLIAVKITPSGSVKPGEIIKAMIEKFALPITSEAVLIHRTGLYVQGEKPIEKSVWRD